MAAGGVNLGSATSYFGAETEQFQQGVRRVTTDLDSMSGTYDQFSSRGARSFLMLSGGMADLTKMSSMSAAGIAGSLDMMSFHFGHMAEQMHDTAGAGAKAMEAIGKSAMTASLIVGALMAGWQVGRWISDVTGLTAAVSTAKKPSEELAKTLLETVVAEDRLVLSTEVAASMFGKVLAPAVATSGTRFDDFKKNTLHVADALGVLVPEQVRNATANLEGAKAVVEFDDKLHAADKTMVEYLGPLKAIGEALAKAKTDHDNLTRSLNAASLEAGAETIVMKDRNAVLSTAYDVITKHIAVEKEWTSVLQHEKLSGAEAAAQTVVNAVEQQKYIDTLITTNNLLKDPDPAASLEQRTEDMRLLGDAGADAGKLLKSDLAGGYVAAMEAALASGKKIDQSSIELGNAIKDNNVYAVEMWMKKYGEMPQSVDDAVKAATPHLDEFQKKLAEGIQQPFGAGLKAFRELTDEIAKTKVKVNFEVDIPGLQAAIRQAINAAANGSVPDTTGTNR